jgi:hypothetical protein
MHDEEGLARLPDALSALIASAQARQHQLQQTSQQVASAATTRDHDRAVGVG